MMDEGTELSLSTTSNVHKAKTELQILAEHKTVEILGNIERVYERIKEATKQSEIAGKMKTGILRTGRKATVTADALVKTNESMAEMNGLIRESVKFTCSSIEFARVMHKTMAHLISTGFRDANGNIIKLSGETKEFANMILESADDFVRKQEDVEKKQVELGHVIEEHEARLKEKDLIDQAQTDWLNRIDQILKKQDSIDKEQSERLNLLNRLIDEEISVDEKQEKSIKLLFEYMQVKQEIDNKQQSEIDAMKLKIKRLSLATPAIVLSILGLLIAVTAIVLIAVK